MRWMRRLAPLLSVACATAVTAAVLLQPLSDAAAREMTTTSVTRWLAGVEVGKALEHRLVVVHPLLRTVAPGEKPLDVAMGAAAGTETLAFGKGGTPSKLPAVNFAETPTAFFPGDALRTQDADFAVIRTTVLVPGKEHSLPVGRMSREADDPASAETRTLGPILPSPLRYVALREPGPNELLEASAKWAIEVGLATPRRSAAELFDAEKIRARTADYAAKLTALPTLAAGPGRAIVGCAVVLDGAPALFETWPDSASFAAAWPLLVKAVAVEASVLEMRENLLDQAMSPPADPDRFTAEVKKRLLEVFGARTSTDPVRELGEEVQFALDGAVATALVLPGDRVAHFVLVTDPARRAEKPHEDPEPGPISRKARPTEEERRYLERRQGGIPNPNPNPPPPPEKK
jgi:ARG/rhodanese/phosphatase superfamily protein